MEKSKVWKYFIKIKDNPTAQCLRCPKQISIKSSNTTGLVRHLKHIHKICLKTQSELDEQSGHLPPEQKRSKTVRSTPQFEMLQKELLEEIVSTLAAKDGLTIHQIIKSDFIREAIQQKGLKLPKNESDAMRLILQYYERKKKETIIVLDQIKQSDEKKSASTRFSLSVDEWTSLKCRRYFNICVHHTDDTFYNLGLVYIPGKCGAKKTKEIVEKRLQEFGLCLKQDIVAVTSDGTNVMVEFGRESPTEMILCLNHAIHLSVIATFCKRETDKNINDTSRDQYFKQNYISSDEKSEDEADAECINDGVLEIASTENVGYIQNIQQALTETRALVTLFRKSPLKNAILQKYVKEELGHELQLLLDVRTRWNSMMQMVERFLKLKYPIKKTLIDLNMAEKWNDNNTNILESLLKILHPVKLSVEALSRKDCSILAAEAIIEVLIHNLRSMEDDLAGQFVEHLIGKISERRNMNLISLAKYLHNPITYSNENIFQLCNKMTLIKYTEELYNRLYPSSNYNSTEASDFVNQDNGEDLKLDKDFFEYQLKKAIQTAVTSDKTSCANITKNLIKKEFQLFESTGQRTPTLEKIFKAVMTIKPTSTENERVFSISGNIVCKIRNRLSDDAVNALVFLKAYFLRKNC